MANHPGDESPADERDPWTVPGGDPWEQSPAEMDEADADGAAPRAAQSAASPPRTSRAFAIGERHSGI